MTGEARRPAGRTGAGAAPGGCNGAAIAPAIAAIDPADAPAPPAAAWSIALSVATVGLAGSGRRTNDSSASAIALPLG